MTQPIAAPGCVAPLTDPHHAWDAGALGCGELVLELRLRLLALQPGERLLLTAQDPGAREDLPAFCRMTGHLLVQAVHPHYLIQRRSKP